MNTDDEGSDEDGSESEEEAQADPFENIDALSDEEVKEELREAQQRRLMEESQVRDRPQPHNSYNMVLTLHAFTAKR